MITNKDLSIDSENGKITLNGNKYDLGTQGEIDAAVKDVYSVMGQMGAKNLIPYPYASNSYSSRSITFTCLSDGTINANGTNDGTGNSTFMYVTFILSKGSYVINGCPTQTGTNYRCGIVRVSDDVTLAADYGRGANFTLNADTEVKAFVQVYNGKTVNNLIFKPMLRLAADTDNTYQPYAMTNKQLTEQVAEVKGTIGDLTQTGVTGADVASQLGALDTAIEGKRSLTPGSAAATEVDISTAIGSSNTYTTPHEGFVRVRGNSSGETYLYIFDKLAYIIPNFNSLISIWLPKGVPMYFDDQHYAPGLAQWFSCSND